MFIQLFYLFILLKHNQQDFKLNILEDVYANKNADGILKNRSTRRGAVGIDAEKDAIYAHVR